jgi:hypothetical protein
MKIQVAIALITAATSLVVAGISYIGQRRTGREQAELARKNSGFQKDLELLRSELADQASERDARRDYEYDARKHLYEVGEPLLFQLAERCEQALWRIYNLAEAARNGNLGAEGWLSRPGYYMKSTMYRIFAPLAVFRLLQERLTVVDLTLDQSINARYSLGKLAARSLMEHFEVAKLAGLPYDPHPPVPDDVWEKLITEKPEQHWSQGLPSGLLDNAVEAIIVRGAAGEPSRCMTFGEFDEAFGEEQSAVHRYFNPVGFMFSEFHPRTRPILWIILLIQAQLYTALTLTRDIKASSDEGNPSPERFNPLAALSKSDRTQLDWRAGGDQAGEEESLNRPLQFAQLYLRERLGNEFASTMPEQPSL